MLFSNWLFPARRQTAIARGRSCLPRLEWLEDRLTPSITVTTTADGVPGSLRDAINMVNAGLVADNTIILPMAFAPYLITLPGPDTGNNAGGAFDVTHDLILQGASPNSTVIDGNGATIHDRVFDIIGTVTVSISGVNIENGNVNGDGGGIRNTSGTLTLTNCFISSNTASFTGGTSSGNGDGGGIFSGGGTLNVNNCLVTSNTGGNLFGGGGIAITGGAANISDSTITENNSAIDKAGGIYNGGALTMSRCTLSGNTSSEDGGAMVNGATANVTNCTVYGNTANDDGGGIFNLGTLNLLNDTITNNTAGNSGTTGEGGGVFQSAGVTDAQDTIIAKNLDPVSPAFTDIAGVFVSSGFNLIGNNPPGSGFVAPANLVGTQANPLDPLLGPLANNGGPTETQAELPGSPAIDHGSGVGAPPTDQRGMPRPDPGDFNGVPDIGAYELQDAVAPPPSVSVAFGPFGEVIEIVSSNGTLTQYDAFGVHVLGGGVRASSVAFNNGSEVLLITFADGALIQFDAAGTHVLGTSGTSSASVAFGSYGEVIEVVDVNGNLTQYDASGAHVLGGGVQSASVAYGPYGLVIEVLRPTGTVTQYNAFGSQLWAGVFISVGVAFDPNGSEVALLLGLDNQLIQYDAAGAHSLGPVS